MNYWRPARAVVGLSVNFGHLGNSRDLAALGSLGVPGAVLGVILGALGSGGCDPPLNVQLVGTYSSMTCETTGAPNTYYYREATFSPNNYNGKISFYSDSACLNPTLVYEQQGAYRLGQSSSVVAGATEAEFDATARVLTAQTAAAATDLNARTPCGDATAGGWTAGVRRDITQYGCKDLIPPSIGQLVPPSCPIEYDLVMLTGSTVYLGKRAAALAAQCVPTGRPLSLGAGLGRKVM